jgi:hypothetical protein
MRCSIVDGFDGEIVATIQRVLSQINSFVETFLRASEFIRNQEVLTVRLATYENSRVDLRTHYQRPCNEVAAILLDDSMGADADIILHQKVGGLQGIIGRQSACDPLHFPSLFPHGELGWDLAVLHEGDAAIVTATEFHVASLPPTDSTSRSKRTQCYVSLQDYFCARFPTTAKRVPNMPGSTGTSRLVCL